MKVTFCTSASVCFSMHTHLLILLESARELKTCLFEAAVVNPKTASAVFGANRVG